MHHRQPFTFEDLGPEKIVYIYEPRVGAIVDPDGLDIEKLEALKAEGKSVVDLHESEEIDDIIGVECDIWIPAARPDVLRKDNVDRLKARLVLQGANIPATHAEQRMHERGILSIPDFIANARGVILAAVEYRGGTQRAAFDAIAEKIAANTRAMLELAKAERMSPREAATKLARAPDRAGDELAALADLSTPRTHHICEALNAIDWLNMVQTQWQTKLSP